MSALEAIGDQRPTEEIVEAAVAEENEEVYGHLIRTLKYRATRDVFEAVGTLVQSEDSRRRVTGVDVLAEFGIPERVFAEETISLLAALLDRETDEDVMESICIAFGHNADAHVVEPLVRLKGHPNARIREAVVFGLLTQEDDLAVQALVELSSDPDDGVRNWATFGLGDMIDLDTLSIREALVRRIDDSFDAVRGEALKGLARRCDERVIEPLVRELYAIAEVDEWWDYAFEAAEHMPSAQLHPALVAARENGIEDRALDHAIALCRTPDPEEGEDKPTNAPSCCPVCGLKRAFRKSDSWQFCKQCGWTDDPDQRLDPDSVDGFNRRSLNQERERWKARLEAGRRSQEA